MFVRSSKKAIELVRSQILVDNDASIRRLQEQLETTDERLETYSETVAMILKRLRKRFPKAYLMNFRPHHRFGWLLTVADGTNIWPEDNGTVALARQIRNELKADWLQIGGPEDSV